ncbi:hypothetical protein P6166_07380 [Stenotrophomonas sp. HITSZ_GD]|uniref:hypothetical protein n=1 Tax=Stenotrophomonas sp. HITSZ_GD TaxID=3037248 RepID=UPI00240D5398|nr:hypothetical protein [Stenotrophomonas sp. HITSZ_GD]MDG2525173.1 hypothetical protein [Stenotrophomonas sp. HITSZ_GD]
MRSRSLVVILGGVLALAGCHPRGGVTSTTRATTDGHDTLFSQVEQREGVADFHCLASTTGHCHYLVFVETCPGGGGQGAACPRTTLQRLDLKSGQTQQVKGLPKGFGQCVDVKAPTEDCAPG